MVSCTGYFSLALHLKDSGYLDFAEMRGRLENECISRRQPPSYGRFCKNHDADGANVGHTESDVKRIERDEGQHVLP